MLFERICQENGITQRLTRPRSPTTTGKIERLHQTLQLLNVHAPFASIEDAQAAVDAWRKEYKTGRPHQSLAMAFPSARFTPAAPGVLGLWIPVELTRPAKSAQPGDSDDAAGPSLTVPPADRQSADGQAVELDRVVPPSGNLWLAGQQSLLGPAMTGRTIGLWAGLDRVHVLLDGYRVKTLPSRRDARDLARLVAAGARPAGPPPLAPACGDVIELERTSLTEEVMVPHPEAVPTARAATPAAAAAGLPGCCGTAAARPPAGWGSPLRHRAAMIVTNGRGPGPVSIQCRNVVSTSAMG